MACDTRVKGQSRASSNPVGMATKTSVTPVFATKGRSSGMSFNLKMEESPEAASNLRTFRMLFDEHEEADEKDTFVGFSGKDELRLHCKQIQDRINGEIRKMKNQIRKAQLDLKRKNAGRENQAKKLKMDSDAVAADSPASAPELQSKQDNDLLVTDRKTSVENDTDSVYMKTRRSVGRPRKAPVPETTPSNRRTSPRNDNQTTTSNSDQLGDTNEIRRKVEGIKTEIIPVPSVTAAKCADEKFTGFPENSPLRQACKVKLESITAEIERKDDVLKLLFGDSPKSASSGNPSFIGFAPDDPLRKSVLNKWEAIATELAEFMKALVESQDNLRKKAVTDPSSTKGTEIKPEHDKNERKSVDSREGSGSSLSGSDEQDDDKDLEGDIPSKSERGRGRNNKKQVKVLHPNENTNMKKGPRIKTVRFCGGPGQTLPLDKFLPHQYPWDQDYGDASGTARSSTSNELLVDLSSATDFKPEHGADGEILLGRQRGTTRPRSGLIKAIIPFTTDEIANCGFPVIATAPFPPRPLCFLCGSAGIAQLIFCSICCEPYHPFCVGDDALLASFVVLIRPDPANPSNEGPNYGKQQAKELCLTPTKGQDLSTRCRTSASDDEDGEITKIQEKLSSWTCSRCLICTSCGRNERESSVSASGNPSGKKTVRRVENKFVKCSNCRDAFHTACLGKRYDHGLVEDFDPVDSDDEEVEQQWLCENCAKCRSCGIKLEKDVSDKKKKKNNLMLCVECFRRRQKGSFCPMCNVSYDDNDYDTRMMECGVCEKWIHGRCEGISEEQYQVLSHLPECIEYVCKLCDSSGFPLWLQAVRMEIVNGCESILRIFTKKALTETRKRKSLNFDLPMLPEVVKEKSPVLPEIVKEKSPVLPEIVKEKSPVLPEVVVKEKSPMLPEVVKEKTPTPERMEIDSVSAGVQPNNENALRSNSEVAKRARTRSSARHLLLSTEARKNDDADDSKDPNTNVAETTSCSSLAKETPVPEAKMKERSSLGIKVKDISERRTTRSSRKKLKTNQFYETSDGNIVPILNCSVVVEDILKASTEDSNKFITNLMPALNNSLLLNDDRSVDMISDSDAATEILDISQDSIYSRSSETTPKKEMMYCTTAGLLRTPIGTTPHMACTPSKKVIDFTGFVKTNLNLAKITSVVFFQQESLEILDEVFGDLDDVRRKKFREEFVAAVKEVFSWFDENRIRNSELFKLNRLNEQERLLQDSPKLLNANPFENVFWSEDLVIDSRKCSFCEGKGDLNPDGCGRLLWAGVNEWIHVNCALWSSEVWEEDSGALQQVGQALSRSKNSKCVHCSRVGASVSCCHSACRKSYHFPCAVKANCFLKLDKTVFCSEHGKDIDPSFLQHEYQVLRKVFVDFEWIKRKEKPVLSSEIQVFIGSLKVHSLGEIIPISVCPNPLTSPLNSTFLRPSDYHCSRLFWSRDSPMEKSQYEFSGSVRKDWFRSFVQNYTLQDVNIVINHENPVETVQEQFRQLSAFHSWVNSAPKLIDEFDVEWIPQLHTSDETEDEISEAGSESAPRRKRLYSDVEESDSTLSEPSSPWEEVVITDTDDEEQSEQILGETAEAQTMLVQVYEGVRHLNHVLEMDLHTQSVDNQMEMGAKEQPEVVAESRIKAEAPVNNTNFRGNFIQNLKANLELRSMDEKAFMYSTLDGAVNDSSSDTSSSSSSDSSRASSVSGEETTEVSESESTSSEEDSEDESPPSPPIERKSLRLSKASTTAKENEQKKSAVKTRSSAASVPSPARQLRSRGKKQQSKHLCKHCKSPFSTAASLSKHDKYCKAKKSNIDSKQKQSLIVSSSDTKKKRGRPPSKNLKENNQEERSESGHLEIPVLVPASSFLAVDEQAPSQSSGAGDNSPCEEEQSKTCPKCSNIYKTVESLRKHIASQTCVSSSGDDDMSEDDQVLLQSTASVQPVDTSSSYFSSYTPIDGTSTAPMLPDSTVVDDTTTTSSSSSSSESSVSCDEETPIIDISASPPLLAPADPEDVEEGQVTQEGGAQEPELITVNTSEESDDMSPENPHEYLVQPADGATENDNMEVSFSEDSEATQVIPNTSYSKDDEMNAFAGEGQTVETPESQDVYEGEYSKVEPDALKATTTTLSPAQHVVSHVSNCEPMQSYAPLQMMTQSQNTFTQSQGQDSKFYGNESLPQMFQSVPTDPHNLGYSSSSSYPQCSAVEAATAMPVPDTTSDNNIIFQSSPYQCQKSFQNLQFSHAQVPHNVQGSSVGAAPANNPVLNMDYHIYNSKLPGAEESMLQGSGSVHSHCVINNTAGGCYSGGAPASHTPAQQLISFGDSHSLPSVSHCQHQMDHHHQSPIQSYGSYEGLRSQQQQRLQSQGYSSLQEGHSQLPMMSNSQNRTTTYVQNSSGFPMSSVGLPQVQDIQLSNLMHQYQSQQQVPEYRFENVSSAPVQQQQQHSNELSSSLMQQLNMGQSSFIQEPMVRAGENMQSVPQGLPIITYNPSSQNMIDSSASNVTYIVVQQGNTLSTVPIRQNGNTLSVGPHESSLVPMMQHGSGTMSGVPVVGSSSTSSPPNHSGMNTIQNLPQTSQGLIESREFAQQHNNSNINNFVLNSNVMPATTPVAPPMAPCTPSESNNQIPAYCLHKQLRLSDPSLSGQPCACANCQQVTTTASRTTWVSRKQKQPLNASPIPIIAKQPAPRPLKTLKQILPVWSPGSQPSQSGAQDKSQILAPSFGSSPSKREGGYCPTSSTARMPSPGPPVLCLDPTAKVPITSPNIAVVRPLENPLQKMSNQIAQLGVNVISSVPQASGAEGQLEPPPVQAVVPLATGVVPSNILPKDPTLVVPANSSSPARTNLRNIYPRPAQTTDAGVKPVSSADDSSKEGASSVKSTIIAGSESDSKGKSIKVTLKRKEGGDSYSINDIKQSGTETTGSMRSLRIKAKITSGEQAGMATDVVVTPLIQTIPIVSELKNGNGSLIGYDEEQGLVCTANADLGRSIVGTEIVSASCPQQSVTVTNEGATKASGRLTHRAVIVYEVKCNESVLFRSSDVRAVWGHIFETVQGTRLKHKLPPLAYPATNISLPENRREAATSYNMLGLTHQAVQFLLEQLPGTNSVMEKHKFRFHQPSREEDSLPPANPTGCARTEGFSTRKPFDMFGWLASRYRTAPAQVETGTDWAKQDLPIAMRYRNLHKKSSNTLGVFYSAIHGRGLFTRRDIPEGEIIIEYAGELIRTILSDCKEKYYESRGIGCYFFKIDENVIIDATMKGNAARFINHSCEPNCKSKAVEIQGKKHILIFAERKILGGEELTYDYKFALEDYDKKIPCTCGARKCRKYLN